MITTHSKRKIPRGGINLKWDARIRRERLWKKVLDIDRRKRWDELFNKVVK